MSKKPQEGSSSAYAGTQIASFDLRRTTTQTAIQMAMVLGRGASKDRVFSRIESLRSAAQDIFHGCLQKPLMFEPNVDDPLSAPDQSVPGTEVCLVTMVGLARAIWFPRSVFD